MKHNSFNFYADFLCHVQNFMRKIEKWDQREIWRVEICYFFICISLNMSLVKTCFLFFFFNFSKTTFHRASSKTENRSFSSNKIVKNDKVLFINLFSFKRNFVPTLFLDCLCFINTSLNITASSKTSHFLFFSFTDHMNQNTQYLSIVYSSFFHLQIAFCSYLEGKNWFLTWGRVYGIWWSCWFMVDLKK